MNKGDLGETYKKAVGEVHASAKALEHETLLASADAGAGDTVLGGRRAIGVDGKSDPKKSESGKAARNAVLNALIDQIAQMQADLDQMIADREAIFEELAEITARQTQLKKWQDALNGDDLLERNADGSFADKGLEALIAAYEEQNGHAVDRSDPAAIALIVAAEVERQRQAGIDANANLDNLNKRIGEKQAEIDAAQQDRNIADSVNYDDRAVRKAAFDANRDSVEQREDIAGVDISGNPPIINGAWE